MADDDSNIRRKVYFFKVEHFSGIKESLPGAFERIQSLEFDDDGRYKLDKISQTRLCAFPDSLTYPLRIRFGKTRRDALPQIEHQGSLSTLALKEDEGLIDICHVMIFEDGFVAAEWNHEGPKIAQLSPYLVEKGRMNTSPTFLILMERDIVEVVKSLTSVRFLEIDVPPDVAELAREADENIYAAIKASEALGATKRVALRLTSDRGTVKLRDLARRLAELIKARPHERERFKGLNVSGYGGDSRLSKFVDILENKLVSSEEFVRSSLRSRSLDSEDAYRVIQNAYKQNLEKMKLAATSSDWG